MEEQLRQDRSGALAAPLSGTIYEGRVARVHGDNDPLVYQDGNEYRDLAEVKRIVDQLQGASVPFTLLHPNGLVARGAQARVVGRVVGGRLDGDHAVAQILVTDPIAVAAINAGMHELSLGYTSVLDGQRKQTRIQLDHLALVPKARCGSSCSLRADCDLSGQPCMKCAIGYSPEVVANQPNQDADLSAKQRHALPGSMFADPKHEGLPLEDETHVRDAMARFDQEKFSGPADRKAAFHRIVARAHQLGIDPAGFMKKYGSRLDGDQMDDLSQKLDAAIADAAAQKARADAAETKLAEAQTALTAAQVEATNANAALAQAKLDGDGAADTARAEMQVKLDAQAARIAELETADKAKFDAAVQARTKLLNAATAILPPKGDDDKVIDYAAMSDRDLKVKVIKHVDNIDVPDDALPAFVDGVYLGSIKRADQAASSRANVRAAIVTNRDAAQVVVNNPPPKSSAAAEAEARAKMAAKSRVSWTKPVTE